MNYRCAMTIGTGVVLMFAIGCGGGGGGEAFGRPALQIATTSSLPTASVGAPYQGALAVSGGVAPFRWTVSHGALPQGLALDTDTGVVFGVATTAGSSTFGVQVTDSSQPLQTATRTLTLDVLPTSGGGNGTFVRLGVFSVGANTRILSGDFDGDGNADLALIESSLGTSFSEIYLGAGDGTFTRRSSPGVGQGATAPVSADFNEDGSLDLAVADSAENTISILLGDGAGFFSRTILMAGRSPVAMVSADFDGDGHSDVAVASAGDDELCVLRGRGDGSFAPTWCVSVPDGPRDLAVGDFDGNGVADIAVAAFARSTNDGTVTILRGVGDGTFDSREDILVPIGPNHVVTADFDGDGALDIIAGGESEAVHVLLGAGDGSFSTTAARSPSVPTNSSDLGVGDFNGDGMADLVTVDGGQHQLSVLLSVGGGAFGQPISLSTGGLTDPIGFLGRGLFPNGVAVADFDNDGSLDLASVNPGSASVTVFLGN